MELLKLSSFNTEVDFNTMVDEWQASGTTEPAVPRAGLNDTDKTSIIICFDIKLFQIC